MLPIKIYLSVCIVTVITACAGAGSGSSDSSAAPDTEFDAVATTAAGLTAMPGTGDEPVAIHRVPMGSYVMAIDEENRYAILGNPTIERLGILSIDDGTLQNLPTPMVPRMALPLGKGKGFAVFGHAPAAQRKKGDMSTTEFAIVKNGEIEFFSMSQPVEAVHGAVSGKTHVGQLLLADRSSDTIVFIWPKIIDLFIHGKKSGDVPIGRLSLKNRPAGIEAVGTSLLAISFVDQGHFEIIDLSQHGSRDRVRQAGPGPAILFARIPNRFKSEFFLTMTFSTIRQGRIDSMGADIDLFIVADYGYSLEAQRVESRRLDLKQRPIRRMRESTTNTAVFEVSQKNSALWIGYGNRLFVFETPLDESESSFDLNVLAEHDLPVTWIENLYFFDNDSHVIISAPDDGLVMVFSTDQLMGG